MGSEQRDQKYRNVCAIPINFAQFRHKARPHPPPEKGGGGSVCDRKEKRSPLE